MTNSKLNEILRAKYLNAIREALEALEEDVVITGSNEIAVPCVDTEGNEKWCVITVKIPTGSREDGEAYDGYAVSESYAMKCKEKREKAKAAAEAKAKKIARDKAAREKAKSETKVGE